MKEYGIYIKQGTGTPYMIHFFNNINKAKAKLYEMIELDEEREKPYFVDNDFFDNKYKIATKVKYYCIKSRDYLNGQNFLNLKQKLKKRIIIILFF